MNFTTTEFIAVLIGALVVGFGLGFVWQSLINVVAYMSRGGS